MHFEPDQGSPGRFVSRMGKTTMFVAGSESVLSLTRREGTKEQPRWRSASVRMRLEGAVANRRWWPRRSCPE